MLLLQLYEHTSLGYWLFSGQGYGLGFVFWISAWDLVGALCVGLYLGFRRGIQWVLCVLDCIWEVLCVLGVWKVEFLGGLRNGVKV